MDFLILLRLMSVINDYKMLDFMLSDIRDTIFETQVYVIMYYNNIIGFGELF